MPVVALDRLSKRYGARLAVDEVSFEVARGEILGLLGPNGSGKTTVLRMLTGYLRPSAGTAEVAGLDVVRDGRAARGRVGYVPEDAPLYRHMRVDEFLIFMGRLRGLDGPQPRARARARPRAAGARTLSARRSSPACPAATGNASRSPRPCCTTLIFWCSTSRRTVSTRARSSSSAGSCARRPSTAR